MRILTFDSSMLERAVYNSKESSLVILFKNESAYVYSDVPEALVNDFEATDSAGRFFNQEVKGLYDEQKITLGWLTIGSAIEDIKTGDMLEYCPAIGKVRKFKLPPLKKD